MRKLLSIVALCVAPAVSHAGDPCPIAINIYDLGVPSWLDRNEVLNELQVQHQWIGIRHKDTDDGIMLTYIHPGSGAALAGLQQGDIVTALNAVRTTNVSEREALFNGLQPGDTLEFTRLDQAPVTVRVGNTDPAPIGMIQALQQQDCRDGQLHTADATKVAAIMPMLFNENRGFRCNDAHIALQPLGERYDINDVYFVRGSRRVLMTMPHWGTVCINSDTIDGDDYTTARLLEALHSVTVDYVQDRFENP